LIRPVSQAFNGRRACIVFDLGGVLIDWDPRYLYRQLFDGDGTAMEHFLAQVCSPAWNAQQDAGRSFAEAIAEKTRAFPEYEHLIQAYFARWTEMIRGSMAGTVEVLSELREQGYPLYALSNWSAETFPLIKHRFSFLDWFKGIVLSGEVGCAKPNPRIYRIFLERMQCMPDQCLFIDDSRDNIATARELGFATLLFRSPQQLRAYLQSKGLSRR